jgi:hypothetical protein
MRKSLAVAAILIAFAFSTAINSKANNLPGQRTPEINRRERRQAQRLRRGVRNGSLTRRETERLAAQQARIRAHEARAKSDGTVTARERASIRRQESRASRNIYRQKHDRQRRN